MILDAQRFVTEEKGYWQELETFLHRLDEEATVRLTLEETKRFHYLYRRLCEDLSRVSGAGADEELRSYLEALAARAFAEIHETRNGRIRIRPVRWFITDFPRAFRRCIRSFALAVLLTVAGALFGGAVVAIDPQDKEIILPFDHLTGSPAERVKREESGDARHLSGRQTSFASQLMTHNTQVAILCMALGMTWGVGTVILLFYNGVILGAVVFDYVAAGQGTFLAGWLLPHGVIEIPAILVAGQAGLLMARALLGGVEGRTAGARLRVVRHDLMVLMGGVATMLVWAGIIESFLSQYHEPVLPYALKIAFGLAELAALVMLLGRGGRKGEADAAS